MSEPKIEQRTELPYLGIRMTTPWQNLPTVIPNAIGEVFGYLGQQGIQPRGAPLIRYHVIDMERELDVEIGVPVESASGGNGQIKAGSLPAGRYASLIHVGPYPELVQANARLLDWIRAQGARTDSHATPEGEEFASRFEAYLSEPEEKPERTEVAIKLRE